jgi:hypothetical protein
VEAELGFPTAEKAERHLAYRAHVAARLARLAELLEAWDEWDVDQLLPPAERGLKRPPEGGREALKALYVALRTELDDIDGLGAPTDAQLLPVMVGVGVAHPRVGGAET